MCVCVRVCVLRTAVQITPHKPRESLQRSKLLERAPGGIRRFPDSHVQPLPMFSIWLWLEEVARVSLKQRVWIQNED